MILLPLSSFYNLLSGWQYNIMSLTRFKCFSLNFLEFYFSGTPVCTKIANLLSGFSVEQSYQSHGCSFLWWGWKLNAASQKKEASAFVVMETLNERNTRPAHVQWRRKTSDGQISMHLIRMIMIWKIYSFPLSRLFTNSAVTFFHFFKAIFS